MKIIDGMLLYGSRSRAVDIFLKAKMLEMTVVSIVNGEKMAGNRNTKIHDDDGERVYKTRN